jgi:hypothetical protein
MQASSECPGFATVRKPKRGKAPVPPESLCTLFEKDLTSPIGAPGRRLFDTPYVGLVASTP